MSLTFLLLYLFGLAILLISARPICCEGEYFTRRNLASIRLSYKPRSFLLLFFVISLGFLCATRSMDSYDTFVYVPWYKHIQSIPLFQRDGSYGILFEVFAKFVAKILHGDYHIFFFLVSSFNLIVVYKAIMNDETQEETAMLSYLLYLVFIGFYYSFIVLRQGMAITMVISGYCILDKSKKKALLLCIAGALFHETAWIAVLCVLIYNTRIKLNKIVAYFSLILSLLFYITHSTTSFIAPVLQTLLNALNRVNYSTFHKYILYFEETALTYNISLLYVMYYLLTMLIVFFVHNKQEEIIIRNKDRFYIAINVVGLSMIGFFAAASAITRLAEYMVSCTYIFLIPNLLKRIRNRRDSKLIIAIIAIVITLLHLRIILGPIDLFV